MHIHCVRAVFFLTHGSFFQGFFHHRRHFGLILLLLWAKAIFFSFLLYSWGLTEHIHRATCLPDSSFPLSLTKKNSSRAERLSSLIPPLPPYVLRILSLWRVYWVLILTLFAVGLLLWFIFVHVYGAFFFSRFLIIHHFSSLTRFFVLFLTTCDVFHTSFWMCLVDFFSVGLISYFLFMM